MSLHLEDIDLLEQPTASGRPRMLPIDAIDEDLRQPRFEFDEEALAELADSIRQRGVRQPVSVRRSKDRADRWTLNFGARRLRASRIAGLREIPAFEDNTADSFDQLMENELRAALTPLELALFVKRHLDDGMTKAEIARRMAKSKTHVTMICALIDAPDWLMEAYRSGACRGIRELYELRKSGQSTSSATAPDDAVANEATSEKPAEEEVVMDVMQSTAALINQPGTMASARAADGDDHPGATRDEASHAPPIIEAENRLRVDNSVKRGTALQDPLQTVLALFDRLGEVLRQMKVDGLDEVATSQTRQRLAELLEVL